MDYGGKDGDHMNHIVIDTALPVFPESYDVLLQLLEKAECQIKRSAYISK